ncbi:CoA pyrophosphatase [uncultured Planktosalinus sp.]|uniref:NUDIX hydrolase n=1 Tax=uncultured Planktosalinus sp. TaxID=1810935 RepID=UPI0030D7A783
MEFNEFKESLSKVKKLSLPGENIQLKMAPAERLNELKRVALMSENVKRAGVMVLFYPTLKNETNLILILRKTYKGVHSAQVGFPGGRYEIEDKDLQHTAIRETEEEIGVPRKKINVLKQLTEMYIPPSNFIVQPYLGYSNDTPQFIAQPSEVEDLIEVKLTHFLDDKCICTQTLSTSYAKNIQVPAYELNGHIVWGATAMILSEVRHLIKEVL